MTEPDAAAVAALRAARRAEKRQTLFYRVLSADAESAARSAEAERLNGLLADEQHHLSRLSARLLELGQKIDELRDVEAPPAALHGWEDAARERERDEVSMYEALEKQRLDATTAALVAEILEAERQHERSLGGKWMQA